VILRQDVSRLLSAMSPERLSALRGTHLLLTGGTGFLGSWLLELIAALNDRPGWVGTPCHVFIPTRDPDVFAARFPHLAQHPHFTFLRGDILTFTPPALPCEWVLHAASPTDRRLVEQQPLEVLQTITAGMQRILALARDWQVKQLLFVSSGAVYGPQPFDCERLPESWPGAPDVNIARSAYPEAKRLAETLCAIYRDKYALDIVIARPFTFVGPYQTPDLGFAITDFIRDGLQHGELLIKGDGTTVRSYQYGADAAYWLLVMLLAGHAGAYNVGSGEPITMRDLAQKVIERLDTLGLRSSVNLTMQSAMNGAASRYIPDVQRAQTELGLRAFFNLDQALDRTITWFATHYFGLPERELP